jgi:hypothetical protein
MATNEKIMQSASRGRELLYLDLAAALASDHVRASFQGLARSRMTSWIVDIGPNGHEVLFFTTDDPPRALLRVTFTADGRPMSERLDGVATARQRVIATAKRTVLAAAGASHTGFYNSIVIPPPQDPPADAPIEAYLLRTASAPGDVVIGTHWHLLVSSDGSRLLEARRLSHTDLTLPGSHGVPPQDIEITHMLGDTPTEIHVYLSLKYDRPIDVITAPSNTVWRVCADEIIAQDHAGVRPS